MKIGPADGSLTLRTGVAGSAARMGHSLIIVVDDWSATVNLARGTPRSVRLTADLTSLRVESGSGGIKPLSDGDREAIRGNALLALHADQHPEVTFESSSIRGAGHRARGRGHTDRGRQPPAPRGHRGTRPS